MLHLHHLVVKPLAHNSLPATELLSRWQVCSRAIGKKHCGKKEVAGSLIAPGRQNLHPLIGNPKAPHQQRRQTPHERQQEAHETTAQETQPQPQPTPQRQPRHPQPPQRPQRPQPQAAICTRGPALVSLSKRLNVAKLTSAISSSPSVTDWLGTKPNFCGASVVGTADAEAPPARPKVKPAAPSAGIATFVTRFRFEDLLTRGIATSIFRNCSPSRRNFTLGACVAQGVQYHQAVAAHSVSVHLDE
jgi:hypothetical protein